MYVQLPVAPVARSVQIHRSIFASSSEVDPSVWHWSSGRSRKDLSVLSVQKGMKNRFTEGFLRRARKLIHRCATGAVAAAEQIRVSQTGLSFFYELLRPPWCVSLPVACVVPSECAEKLVPRIGDQRCVGRIALSGKAVEHGPPGSSHHRSLCSTMQALPPLSVAMYYIAMYGVNKATVPF